MRCPWSVRIGRIAQKTVRAFERAARAGRLRVEMMQVFPYAVRKHLGVVASNKA